jgi:sugar lactone lactonase YvrE
VDIDRGRVHRFDPRSGEDSAVEIGQPTGSAVPRRGGGLVLGLRDGVGLLEVDGSQRLAVALERELAHTRMNDGKCDSHGRFFTGTMDSHEGGSPAGALYRVDPDLSVTRLVGGVRVSNGLDWNAADDCMYYIDSRAGGVDVFDYDAATGAISGRRRLIDVDAAHGVPDGMTVDAEGGLWVALWDGGALRRYAPDGTLERTVELPVSRVTSCAFGGPDLDVLYITSARTGLAPDALEAQPLAGALFAFDPGVRGRPVNLFAG